MEKLIELFFNAANMERWNDHIRPVTLVELDKQAHKIIIAYIIAKIEEEKGNYKINWIELINKFLFDFFYRLVLTDLKPPVFHELMANKKKELNQYVLEEINPILMDFNPDFALLFKKHIDTDNLTIEDRIIKAAHYLATNWEFKIIYNAGSFIYGVDKTKKDIEKQIKNHYDLEGVTKLILSKDLYGFMDLCGQLRFQKRWAHTPRVPETSVLGHMLVVAAISYMFSLKSIDSPVDKRLYNNFFGGLFHDLPEVLTKDIISPIKRSVEGLEYIIKDYENYQMENKIFTLLPKNMVDELKYLTMDEFDNKIIINGSIKKLSKEEISNYNKNGYNPVDGELIDAADKLAAYAEAKLSLRHGLTSKVLEQAIVSIKEENSSKTFLNLNLNDVYNNLDEIIDE
ncbi:HD domain-containing protein [Methanobrevibacter curvatus]|uniref:5'-nucleotidase n=1 Tax=Methanobrevibacter curvatus TaxID=49547 RepID=A0A166DHD9_9EURY|nr:HD domain-containing protein [Methanobrevibacter curvatus]KZX15604.1 5'-nucleotidase [Methanobrevibacter curvatus]